MFEKILYPTDFSDVAKKALKYIRQLKEAGAKEIVVLHVLDEKGIDAVNRYTPAESLEIIQRIEEGTKKKLKTIQTKLEKEGFTVKVMIKRGIPLQEILAAEKKERVSTLVLGSHGVSNVKEMFLGSVSEKVIRKSTKPVLVVRR